MENNTLQKSSPLHIWRQIALFVNYFIGYMFLYPLILTKLTLLLDPTARSVPTYLQAVVYGGMILISIWLAWPLLKESSQSWHMHRPRLLRTNFIIFLQLYVVTFITSILINLLSGATTSANQTEVVASINSNPMLMAFTTMLFAPIVEEILFRGVFFRTLRPRTNFWIAGLISGLAFGLIHVTDSLLTGNYADLWYIFSYAFIGIFMSYSYEKTGTIYGSFFLHFLNNCLAFIAIMA